ncbi:MAG: cell wall biogenesis glycosyltransferase [Calditrichia bacterium]
MADFFQNGEIVTLHRLKERSIEDLEHELEEESPNQPITLILPSLYSELERPALANIVKQLKNVKFLNEIVITMARMNRQQFEYAKKFFADLPKPWTIIWNDGDRMKNIYHHLRSLNIDPGPDGKGKQVWMAIGYILARGNSHSVVLHDCDIITYDRELLARLSYPMVHRTHPFQFVKGYYARVTTTLHGRVTRLFLTPLIRALKNILGQNTYLDYLDSFRYALAGEFAMSLDLAQRIRFPSDWGLEIGVLSEVYRHAVLTQVAQVDIANTYEHKHQPVARDDMNTGLLKMSTDIAKTLFRTLAAQGIMFTNESFITLKSTYARIANEFIERYAMDAALNGLHYDRHIESQIIESFVQSIIHAGQELLEFPFESQYISSWNRVFDADPKFFKRLISAVEADNK